MRLILENNNRQEYLLGWLNNCRWWQIQMADTVRCFDQAQQLCVKFDAGHAFENAFLNVFFLVSAALAILLVLRLP